MREGVLSCLTVDAIPSAKSGRGQRLTPPGWAFRISGGYGARGARLPAEAFNRLRVDNQMPADAHGFQPPA